MYFEPPQGLGPHDRRILCHLSEETNPQLYYQDLLHWAEQGLRDPGDANSMAGAAEALRFLAQSPKTTETHRPSLPEAIRQRARAKLELLSGRGSLGDRLDWNSHRFLDGATDPAMVLGMALGATAFSAARAFVLPRLLQSSSAGLFTRGLGARLGAATLALFPEVGVFWLSSKGIHEFLRPGTQSWDWHSNGREWASLGLTLGLLKSTGFIFRSAAPRLSAVEVRLAEFNPATTARYWQHAGMLSGIALAHGVEIQLGWRPPASSINFFSDAILTFTQLYLGGRLSQGLFPVLYAFNGRLEATLQSGESRQLAAWAQSLTSRRGIQDGMELSPWDGPSLGLVPVTSRGFRPPLPKRGNSFFSHLMMAQKTPTNPARPKPGKSQFANPTPPIPNGLPSVSEIPLASGSTPTLRGTFFRHPDIPSHHAEAVQELGQRLLDQIENQHQANPDLRVTAKHLSTGDLQIDFLFHTPPVNKLNKPPYSGNQSGFQRDYSAASHLLREVGWGPLLVRHSPGSFPSFRVFIPEFVTPGFDQGSIGIVGRNHPCWVNFYGAGPETPLEQSLKEGFFVPDSSMDMSIYRTLQELPGGPNLLDDSLGIQALQSTPHSIPIEYRRMALIHRQLLGERGASDVVVMENGVGTVVDTTVTLARLRMGRINIKEIDDISVAMHQRLLLDYFPKDYSSRLHYLDLHSSEPADMVYWVNPGPSNIKNFITWGGDHYLGRDVRAGGLVLVQTDHHKTIKDWPYNIHFHGDRWQRIFEGPLPKQTEGVGYAFPTVQREGLFLQIYRKRFE